MDPPPAADSKRNSVELADFPTTQAGMEKEMLSVAADIRSHEQELGRLRRRMDALKQFRATFISATSASQQNRLNLLVHSVVNSP